MRPARSGAEDYRMLLTVIAGISLGVAATALPVIIEGPFQSWSYAAKVVLWFTGVAAGVLEYLAVSFGSRLYLVRVESFATASLALVFLAQAGLFVVLSREDDRLFQRWFAVFVVFCVIAALEANHGRRMVVRHAGERFPPEVVKAYASSLRQVVLLILAVALAALVFVVLGADAPDFVVFLCSCAVFAAMLAANVHQQRVRNTLADLDVLPEATHEPPRPARRTGRSTPPRLRQRARNHRRQP